MPATHDSSAEIGEIGAKDCVPNTSFRTKVLCRVPIDFKGFVPSTHFNLKVLCRVHPWYIQFVPRGTSR